MTKTAAEPDARSSIHLQPDDAFNRELIAQTRPPDWTNPTPQGRYNLVVIGAGTAGLTAAGGCAAVGGRVALIERHLTGGDCLVTGCVPSKALISAARAAATIRTAADYGIRAGAEAQVDFPAVMARMRRLRAAISPHDAVERIAKSGVDVYLGSARFVDPNTIEVNGTRLQFIKAVIATGGRAEVPPISGLRESGYLTNETLFELTELPRRLVVLGGGPIGCEMAQAFRRLGAEVTLIHNAAHILNREDPDAAEIVQRRFEREGIRLLLGATTTKVGREGEERRLSVEAMGRRIEIACEAILVAAGRAPNTEGLGLEAANVAYDRRGVTVNDLLQTTNPRIYAAGDIASPLKFTHAANAFGRSAMMNALFRTRQRASRIVIPWCTYTDPEIAHVGLYEQQAIAQQIPATTLTLPLHENDRAVLEGEEDGFIRVHLRRGSDRILGATIVAARAGELLAPINLAMALGKGLSSLAACVYPYPTQAEALKQIANQYRQTKLTPWVKTVLGRALAWCR